MRLARNVARLLGDALRYAVATRRVSVLLVVVLGLLALAVAVTTQVAVPIALYPFA